MPVFMCIRSGGQPIIELFHGYTYSGHPLAMAAGMATLDVYQEEGCYMILLLQACRSKRHQALLFLFDFSTTAFPSNACFV